MKIMIIVNGTRPGGPPAGARRAPAQEQDEHNRAYQRSPGEADKPVRIRDATDRHRAEHDGPRARAGSEKDREHEDRHDLVAPMVHCKQVEHSMGILPAKVRPA